jgi:hypothetical protein
MSALPEGVESVMFLRDGWPHVCVCKVLMKDGCVGIGINRTAGDPETFDQLALDDAMLHISASPPDYTPLHEHMARMKAAEAKSA